MGAIYQIEQIFNIVVHAGVLLLNAIGVAILLWSAIRCVHELVKKEPLARINFAEGTALALSFKLGAEVLRTVVVHEWSELAILGAVIALRAALAVLLHWEIKNQRKSLAEDSLDEAPRTAEAAGRSACAELPQRADPEADQVHDEAQQHRA